MEDQFVKQSSAAIIKSFLEEFNRDLDPNPFYSDIPMFTEDTIALPRDIVKKIIRDSYNDASPIVKEIANKFPEKFGAFLGRVHKNQLKKYIDYEIQSDFDVFYKLLNELSIDPLQLKSFCDSVIQSNISLLGMSISKFWQNLDAAIMNDNKDRIKDYMVFLYSRLLALNENRDISLQFLFDQEKELIKEELSLEDYSSLERFCADAQPGNRATIIARFNKKYMEIMDQDTGGKKALCYMVVNQQLLDILGTRSRFYSYLFDIVERVHELLRNHRALVIKVENILDHCENLKWDIYSFLTIFAEKFKPSRLNRTYYRGEDICADIIEHVEGTALSPDDRAVLKEYYSDPRDNILLESALLSKPELEHIIKFYEEPLVGFSFNDCFILRHDHEFPNTKEISFIKNNNELLLVFFKSIIDERKIPCPVCGSLKISGNSYTEIGEKSWECKNPLCADRSKTNRGKRYSARTIAMQDSIYDFSTENVVPRELIKIWRKDLVERWNDSQLYSMLVKYYTYAGEEILVINDQDNHQLEIIASNEKRSVEVKTFDDILDFSSFDAKRFQEFLDGSLLRQFIYINTLLVVQRDDSLQQAIFAAKQEHRVFLIQDDCMHAMQCFPTHSIHAMITSPPYYNAREYSQWTNLYNYLNDMYNVILTSKDVLVEGGVFFYNIGDIFDNENTVVKSTMGEKRIPLGAYIILLFERAGFTLLDNIAWYKGEPQSNRQKNDGNFVPFYQRPTNCYEHMLIFKAPGKLKLGKHREQNVLTSNIQKFIPVFKIGKGGVNRYGHTAPFPPDLPLLAVTCFTDPKDYIFDPYSGSGTTAICAADHDRIGIGTEINEEYARLSVELAKQKRLGIKLLRRAENGAINPWIEEDFESSGMKGKKQLSLEAFTK
ncbi:MAG TPA: site-specific DNA-methyltransferase [Candidatus Lokiarchaeia archaeon]|nr:site-specific DNA-methyltransferase [Candidatus Lokiarchaeia archaeon]